VPRPVAEKAVPAAQETWKSGGRRLCSPGPARRGIVLAEELRLELRVQVRPVLGPARVKVTQHLQLRYRWAYLLLTVDPRAESVRWRWLERCRAGPIKDVLAEWAPDAVVRDGHRAHRAHLLADLPIVRVRLPPYSPELIPAERIFQELRRDVEGRTYASVADKQAAADAFLAELAADHDRVRRLCGWNWLTAALDTLPIACLPPLR
jgi:transposase